MSRNFISSSLVVPESVKQHETHRLNYLFNGSIIVLSDPKQSLSISFSLDLSCIRRFEMLMAFGWFFHFLVSLHRRSTLLKPEKELQKGGNFLDSEECASCRSISNEGLPSVEDIKTVMQKLDFQTNDREDEDDDGEEGEKDDEEEEEEEEGECKKCRAVRKVCRYLEEEEASLDELQRAFVVFDKNGDGFIAAEELSSVLTALGFSEGRKVEDSKSMIKAYDLDGDGKICLNEFIGMLQCVA